jgi:phosphopantetheinyl transferase
MQIFLLDATAVAGEQLHALARTLPPMRRADAERGRRKGYYEQSVLGFCLVRYAVGQIAPLTDATSWTYGENGKPRLTQGSPYFNLSHTAYGIAVAVDEVGEVGIDLQEITPHPTLATRTLSPTEHRLVELSDDPADEFIRLWSAKEAKVKYTGEGIRSLSELRNVTTDGVQSARVILGGVPHWLSACPAAEMPHITYVTAAQLTATK